MSPPRRDVLLATGVASVALAIRLLGLGWGLPEIYEEATPLRMAWQMGGWGPNASFDPNPHFFHYPSLLFDLHLAAQALQYWFLSTFGSLESTLDFRVMYALDRTPFYLVGRLITAAFGAAGVAAVYFLTRRVAGVFPALAAALVLATNPLQLRESRTIGVDVPLAFFATWALIEILRVLESPSRGASLRAGLALGLAISSKYTGAFLLVPLALAHGLVPASARGRRGASFLLSLLVAAAVFAATSPFVLLDAKSAWHDLAEEREHMRLGHFGDEGGLSFGFVAKCLAGDALGAPIALLALAAVIQLAFLERKRSAIVLGAYSLVFIAVIGSWSMKADRYLLPATPALLALAAAFLEWAYEKTGTTAKSRLLFTAALALAAAAHGLRGDAVDRASRADDTRTRAKAWIESHCPTGAFLLAEHSGPDVFDAVEYASLEPDVRERGFPKIEKRSLYGELVLPLYQVAPERSAPYYNLSLYEDCDMVLTSDRVSSRYLHDPTRFPEQCKFYDELDARFLRVQVFAPGKGGGPTLALYFNPRHEKPFGFRESLIGPAPFSVSSTRAFSEEATYYSQWGLNYEIFGFHEEALRAYALAIKAGPRAPGLARNLALGVARCRAAAGDRAAAIATLDAALTALHDPTDRRAIELYRRALVGEQSVPR